jgi:Ca2+-binding EF-hand superfamily protein
MPSIGRGDIPHQPIERKEHTMSSINGVGGSSDAWAQMRSQMQAKMFNKADSNADGGVDKTELKSMLNDVSKMTGKSVGGNIDDTFAKMDTSGDGKLSSDELAKGMQNLLPPSTTMDFAKSTGGQSGGSAGGGNPVDDLFSKVDSNGDGSLDKSELKTLAAQIKSDTGMDISAKLDKLADDNGGKVSKDQFQAAIEKERPSGPPGGAAGPGGPGGSGGTQSASNENKTYDKLDTNQDGTVSEIERLVGEIKNATSDKTASAKVANLVKQVYEQFSSNFSSVQGATSLSAVA